MRFLLFPVVVIVLLLGIWITGGQITNDFTVSMVLTAVWMGLAGLTCVALAYRRPRLRLPVLGAYVVTAVVAGGYLASETFIDDVVDERVATAAAPAPGTNPDASKAKSTAPQNVRLGRAEFEPVAHSAEGVATTIRLAEGGRVLTLTDFEVDNGPDLRVYLVAGPAQSEGDVDDYIDLGGLKGNKGNQQYELPEDAGLDRYGTVVIWCRAFSVLFARAPLA
jgi:Electron transfer DM13